VHPELVPGLSSYGSFLWLSVAAGSLITFFAARREKVNGWRLVLFQALLALSAVGGAKIWSWLERGSLGPAEFEVLHNYRYPGGLLGAAVFLLAGHRLLRWSQAPLALADLVAPSIAFAMAMVRIGCFLAGCCFGRPAAVPWALSFPRYSPAWGSHLADGLIVESAPTSLPVHPLELYFGLWSLAVGLVLVRRRASKRHDGEVALLFLLLHEGGKAALELLRGVPRPWVQLASAVAAVLAAAVLVAIRRRSRPRSVAQAEGASSAHRFAAEPPAGRGSAPQWRG
jgi:phosphatidylglycerol:prolipoprotein diacylglycerol transferase